ncbi:MAG: isochorismatase family protein [Deltaproteobacteria bacterium]|nr:isochorismatase family protein [Deltaproteobacteria bacterium]
MPASPHGPADLALHPARTALVVVDIQEKLVPAMQDGAEICIANTARLIEGLAALHVRVLVSEQYPKGLGRTVPVLAQRLAACRPDAAVVEKTEFSAVANPEIRAVLAGWLGDGVRSVLVCGMEAHICVYQTVRGLADMGFVVHVVTDACASRTAGNHAVAVGLWQACGAVVTSTEAALFDLLGRAGGDAFKLISRLIR